MAKSYPDTIPAPYAISEAGSRAYKLGWNHGHGIACHNVPKLGGRAWTENLGHIPLITSENIREVHQDYCFQAESNSRQYSPFEFVAHEFNSQEDEWQSEFLWQAFEDGASDAIFADLSEYGAEDYGIEA